MPYDHDYVCMMQQPVLCELCNKSYPIGRWGMTYTPSFTSNQRCTKRMLKNVEYHSHGGFLVVQNRMLLLEGIINKKPKPINPPSRLSGHIHTPSTYSTSYKYIPFIYKRQKRTQPNPFLSPPINP